jgi:hypothetical protein
MIAEAVDDGNIDEEEQRQIEAAEVEVTHPGFLQLHCLLLNRFANMFTIVLS